MKYYVDITRPDTPGDYCDTNLRSTSNEVLVGGVAPTELTKTVGVMIPSAKPEEAFRMFLAGLPNMRPIAPVSTLLFNFQKWSQDQIDEALRICEDNGFTVRYSINEYDTTEGIPLNLIVEDTARLLPDAKLYLRVDDDLKVLHKSPVIAKSGGTQYLDMIHYAIHHIKCGFVSTTGTIGKYPPRHHLGPHPQRGLHIYLNTSNGSVLNNMGTDLGVYVPHDSLTRLGALEDVLAGAYRLNNGFYSVKYNHVRAQHHGNTKMDSPEENEYGWNMPQVLLDGVVGYIRDKWSPEFDPANLHLNSFTYENYEDNGGIPIWESEVVEKLTWIYSPVEDEHLEIYHANLIQRISEVVLGNWYD